MGVRLCGNGQKSPALLKNNKFVAWAWMTLVWFLILGFQSPARAAQHAPADVDRKTSAVGQPPATPLNQLVEQAERENPEILAARRAWQASTQVASQVSTLPDPQVQVQQLNVGSPRPFAGYTNSDFAYVGLGVSQDLPYPGKLRLRGEVANRQAAALRDEYVAVQRSVAEQVKAAYFRLSYVQQTDTVLRRDLSLLREIEAIAEARYRVGQGNQQDVLKAQLNETKILSEIDLNDQERGSVEASLNRLLNRPPDSPAIVAETTTETPLPYTSDQLLGLVRDRNPEVHAEQEAVRGRGLQVDLARKDFYPDFNVQFMWQRTDPLQFRAYYMLTFGMKLPIYFARRQRPELAEAAEQLSESRRQYEASVQQGYFEVRDQYIKAQTDASLLKIYQQGLIPQAASTFGAGMAAYQAGREDFQTLLDSFLDVLDLDLQYWNTLADHETSLARIQELTGVPLHQDPGPGRGAMNHRTGNLSSTGQGTQIPRCAGNDSADTGCTNFDHSAVSNGAAGTLRNR